MPDVLIDYALIPLLIFLARLTDVSLATLRFLFISGANRLAASAIGFAEAAIWLIAITRILQNLDNPIYYVAYAGGFAAGTYVGIWAEEKLAVGAVFIRIITRNDPSVLMDRLKAERYGVTLVEGAGATGPVHIIFTLVRRRNAAHVIRLIREVDVETFYTVESVRSVRAPIPPLIERPSRSRRRKLKSKTR